MFPDVTPYHYCHNNPINRVDPTGMADGEKEEGGILDNINSILYAIQNTFMSSENKATVSADVQVADKIIVSTEAEVTFDDDLEIANSELNVKVGETINAFEIGPVTFEGESVNTPVLEYDIKNDKIAIGPSVSGEKDFGLFTIGYEVSIRRIFDRGKYNIDFQNNVAEYFRKAKKP